MGLMQPRSELKNQNVPSEDYKLVLHKYKESTSSIAIYLVGYKICTRVPPTRCSSSLRASYKRYGKWWFLYFSFWLFFLLVSFSLWHFSLLILFHTHFFSCQHKIYDKLAQNFCSETTRCKCAKPKQSSRARLNRTW